MMADEQPDDWRLQGQDAYLTSVTLFRRAFRRRSTEWDHDHCEFCWTKFSEAPISDSIQEGYTTEDECRWVCPRCFDDFKQRFGSRHAE